MNTIVMFFSVRTKKLIPLLFRLLQVRWLRAAGFAGFGIHAPTMVEPKRGGSVLQVKKESARGSVQGGCDDTTALDIEVDP